MPAAGALIFFSIGWPFLPFPGLQQDELLFAQPLFHPSADAFHIGFLHKALPVMLMTYLGALKTWLYAPILHFSTSYLSIRLPMLLAGSLTVGIFVLLVEILHSRRAGAIAGILLATDAAFLLTTCFDWGPVALQHIFLVGGMSLALRFAQTGARRQLVGSFLLFGLALWDKALFVWIFSGIAFATICIYPRQLRKRLTRRNLTAAALAFCLGSLPLIVYNVYRGFPTYRSNSKLEFHNFRDKFIVLRATWNGSVLFGYLVNGDDAPIPGQPSTVLERASYRVHSLVGDHPFNRMEPALVAALLLLPLLWRTRARGTLLFCLIAAVVGWLEMAIARGAGGSVHHTILLWPFPTLFVAVAFTEASRFLGRFGPWVLAFAGIYLAGQNLLQENQYFYQFSRDGAMGSWTDAIYPLSDNIQKFPYSKLVVDDWGIQIPLQVIHRGALPLVWAENNDIEILSDPSALWIGHTDANEQFSGVNARLLASAASVGFEKQPVTTIADRKGRPIFELFRFKNR